MGLFGSAKSTTETDVSQADNRQFSDAQGSNLQATDDSVATKVDSGGLAIVNRSTGGGVNITYQDLNAELAKFTVGQAGENLGKSLTFADQQINKIFQHTQQVNSEMTNQLEETREFSAGLLDKVSTTADERFQKFSMGTFITIAGLMGFLIWRNS